MDAELPPILLSGCDYLRGWLPIRLSGRLGHSRHDDVIKWKHFPRHWPFVRGIHRSTVNSPHKGQWCGSVMLSLICTRINGWVNNHQACDLRLHRAHYDVSEMFVLRLIKVAWFGDVPYLISYYRRGAIFLEAYVTCYLYPTWKACFYLILWRWSGLIFIHYFFKPYFREIDFSCVSPKTHKSDATEI